MKKVEYYEPFQYEDCLPRYNDEYSSNLSLTHKLLKMQGGGGGAYWALQLLMPWC